MAGVYKLEIREEENTLKQLLGEQKAVQSKESLLALATFDDSPRIPRGFQPSKVKATLGRSDGGLATTAELSKRRYLKYSVNATSESTRGTAPISADTVASLKTRFQAI